MAYDSFMVPGFLTYQPKVGNLFRGAAVLPETSLHLTENLSDSRCDSSLDDFQ